MKNEVLIRDPVFQLNLLVWMAKAQPSSGYRVRPFFYENRFRLIYIEQPFAFPDEMARAIEASSISKQYTGISADSVEVLHDLQSDTDPSPLLLIYSDQDCPNPERAGYYRRMLINQVVAKLVCDLNLLPIEQTYTISARELLQKTTDGVLNYLALDRQRNMIRIVRQNIFGRIASFWRDKSFTPVQLAGEHLQINFKDNLAKAELMDWLEDPKRTAFIDQLPPTDQPLLPGIDPLQERTN